VLAGRTVYLAVSRNDQYLVQREGDALAQLIVPVERSGKEVSMYQVHRVVIAIADVLVVIRIR
jgi:hypothetical protein